MRPGITWTPSPTGTPDHLTSTTLTAWCSTTKPVKWTPDAPAGLSTGMSAPNPSGNPRPGNDRVEHRARPRRLRDRDRGHARIPRAASNALPAARAGTTAPPLTSTGGRTVMSVYPDREEPP